MPKTDADRRREKFAANRKRNQAKINALAELGYRVLVVWECELKQGLELSGRLSRFWSGSEGGAAEIDGVLDLFGSEADQAHSPVSYSVDPSRWILTRSVRRRTGTVSNTDLAAGEPIVDGDYGSAFDLAWLREADRPDYSGGRGKSIRIADLFSGCGGMSLGVLEAARAIGRRAEIAFAADLYTEAIEVFKENLRPREVESGPIESVLNGAFGDDATDEEAVLKERVGRVDVLLGGPPCQGHSNLNNHTRREDPKNELYQRMARFTELFEPDHVIIENVHGVKHDKGGVFERTRRQLVELGYSTEHGVVYGERLGVAQARHRVFLVASRTRSVDLAAWLAAHRINERPFDWACRDLWLSARNGPMSETSTPQPLTADRIDYLFDEEKWILPDDQRPDCHRFKPHSYKSVYGRIRGDQPAPTITTGFTVMGQGRFVHPYERRTLNPLEGARLQFFPDWFDFGERTRKSYLKLIGNAVPPKMAYVLALELLR